MTQRWVQHISGQGEKWEVLSEYPHGWKVPVPSGLAMGHETWLPKSEYRLCDPPEVWEDVTERLVLTEDGTEASEQQEKVWAIQCLSQKYRLRKVLLFEDGSSSDTRPGQWAFIVERKKP